MSDNAYRLLLMKRALARGDAELFGHRPRYLEVAMRLAALLLSTERGGAGISDSGISGSSAASTRARGPRMQDGHEQETPQEPLAALHEFVVTDIKLN